MKAWEIVDVDSDGHSIVLLAETRGQAKLAYIRSEWCDGWYTVIEWTKIRVLRAPKFDDLDHDPTTRDYIERGWSMPCDRCEARVGGQQVGSCALREPVFGDDDQVYCSAECAAR